MYECLDCLKFPNYAFPSDSSLHSKSSLSATTGFSFSTKFAVERFLKLRNISGYNCPSRSLRLTSESPKKSRSNFQYGVSSV